LASTSTTRHPLADVVAISTAAPLSSYHAFFGNDHMDNFEIAYFVFGSPI